MTGLISDDPKVAKTQGDLAGRMVEQACELACMVRDCEAADIADVLDRLDIDEMKALLVVQAAMIPVDGRPADLLAWVTWDEYGQPIRRPDGAPHPAPRGAEWPEVGFRRRSKPSRYRNDLKPCGTYAAYHRHIDHNEDPDPLCRAAARLYWTERKKRQQDNRTTSNQPAERNESVS